MRIKKGDKVLIINGKEKGKTGKISKVLPKERKIIISGLNILKKHAKPTKKNPSGGIVEIDSPIDISNIMIICPNCSKTTRVGYKILKEEKERLCKKCNQSFK